MHPNSNHPSPTPDPLTDPVIAAKEPVGFPAKQPRIVFPPKDILTLPATPPIVFAFAPNRETLGGTAYLIVEETNVLVDCPAWDDSTRSFLRSQGGVRWLVLTHRGGLGQVSAIQKEFNCEVVIQEQEAYLLPGLTVTAFHQECVLTPQSRVIWTSGHSPGSSCLYSKLFGGIVFTGRHLLPNPQGELLPLKNAKTFHWARQLQSVQRLREQFTAETLHFACPGANTGFLRGQYAIQEAHQKLSQIDLEALSKGPDKSR